MGVLLAVLCHSTSASFYCTVTATCPNRKIFLPYDVSTASSAGCRIGDGTRCDEATPFDFGSQVTPVSCGVSSYNEISSKITLNSYMFDELESCKTFMNNYLKPKADVSRQADFESKGEVQAAACTCGDSVGSLLRMIPALDTSTLPANANQRNLCTLHMQVVVGQLKSATCTKAKRFTLGFTFVGNLVSKFCDTCFDAAGKPITDIVKGMCTSIIDTVFDKLMYPSRSSSIPALVVNIRDDVEDAIDETASTICGATVCRDSSSGGGECSVVPSWIPDSGKKVINIVLQDQGLCSADSDSSSSSSGSTSSSSSSENSIGILKCQLATIRLLRHTFNWSTRLGQLCVIYC